MYNNIVRSTPDNSNLQGKLKKVQVIGSSKQITRSKEMGSRVGEECRYQCTLHFKGSKMNFSILKKELKNKA